MLNRILSIQEGFRNSPFTHNYQELSLDDAPRPRLAAKTILANTHVTAHLRKLLPCSKDRHNFYHPPRWTTKPKMGCRAISGSLRSKTFFLLCSRTTLTLGDQLPAVPFSSGFQPLPTWNSGRVSNVQLARTGWIRQTKQQQHLLKLELKNLRT